MGSSRRRSAYSISGDLNPGPRRHVARELFELRFRREGSSRIGDDGRARRIELIAQQRLKFGLAARAHARAELGAQDAARGEASSGWRQSSYERTRVRVGDAVNDGRRCVEAESEGVHVETVPRVALK